MKNIMMGENKYTVMAGIFGLSLMLLLTRPATLHATSAEIPVKGMVTMVDPGAKTCVLCKMMTPLAVGP